MDSKIEVFLSSRQLEFEHERKVLERKISKIPFLYCKPLERRGASPRSAEKASIKGVRSTHIFVGLFGEEISKIVKQEYAEALKKFKPCFVYVKICYYIGVGRVLTQLVCIIHNIPSG